MRALSLDSVPAENRKHNLFFSMDGKTKNPGGKEMGSGDREVDPLFVDAAACHGSRFRDPCRRTVEVIGKER